VLVYRVGAAGLADSGRLKVTFKFYSDWGEPQTHDPRGANYLTARARLRPSFPGESDATVQRLDVKFDRKGHERPYQKAIIVDVVDGYLSPGDEIEIRLGDRSAGGPGTCAQTFVEDAFKLRTYVDLTRTSRLAVDVVHLLMAMTIWLRFGQNFPVKVVAWDHVDGSALTVASDVNRVEDLAGRTVAVPFWYSIHNVILQQLLRKAGLRPVLKEEPSREARTVKLVILPPPDMPPALARGAIAGFIVADPFNAVAEIKNVGRILRFTGDVWQRHACCVVVMHEDDIAQRPRWAQSVVNALVTAQAYARGNRAEVAKLLSSDGAGYLPQPRPAIERALSHYDLTEYGKSGAVHHPGWDQARIDFQPFPFPSYTERLVSLLKDTLVEGDTKFLRDLDPRKAHAALVDDRFARQAVAAAGGPARLGLPASWKRDERIDP
jgi:NitT/TauT family transport system substrate-binding protein